MRRDDEEEEADKDHGGDEFVDDEKEIGDQIEEEPGPDDQEDE